MAASAAMTEIERCAVLIKELSWDLDWQDVQGLQATGRRSR